MYVVRPRCCYTVLLSVYIVSYLSYRWLFLILLLSSQSTSILRSNRRSYGWVVCFWRFRIHRILYCMEPTTLCCWQTQIASNIELRVWLIESRQYSLTRLSCSSFLNSTSVLAVLLVCSVDVEWLVGRWSSLLCRYLLTTLQRIHQSIR